MAERFNLTAQIQLQAPTNVNQVVGNIRKQLSGITANVQVKGNARGLAQINKQMQGVSKSAGSASKNVNNLSRNLSEAARRFSVITVATGTMLALARAMKDGVGEAIAFERELVRISQVTGKTTKQLKGLTQEVTRLATGLGASSKDLLDVSRTLAQAGFSAEKTKQALDILAKTSLGATFDSIQDTTEGAIAVLSQFRKEARQAGGDIKFLEQTLDAINSVSKKFAVESGDLITVIRRTGGVFEAAGGSVNELIALFTSVRATTRESAETISTGLRTIFTRIQRTDTVDQLKALGIELRNSEGQFVGAMEAFKRLSAGLSGLDPRDFRFSEIVESLGGFRQIGKVIPLIRQFQTAQDALNVAQSASGSVARDAAIAQQALAVQAGKVAQEFKALMREFADSSTFKSVANGALEIARAMIRVADALEPVLPMLGLLAGLKIGRAIGPMLGGMLAGGRGATRRSAGGRISGFASGGHVPGTGNRDTVPAMLTPGEFVIKKSSAKKLGAAKLSAMNSNRYQAGGKIRVMPDRVGAFFLNPPTGNDVDKNFGPLDVDVTNPKVLQKIKKGPQQPGKNKDATTYRRQIVANAASVGDQSALLHGDQKTLKYRQNARNLTGKNNTALLKDKKVQQRVDRYAQSPKGALNAVNTTLSGSVSSFFTGGGDLEKSGGISQSVAQATRDGMETAIAQAVQETAGILQGIDPIDANEQKVFKRSLSSLFSKGGGAIETVEGFIFEGLIAGLTGAKIAGKGNFFDFPSFSGAAKGRLTELFGDTGISSLLKADAKRTYSSGLITSLKQGSIPSKILNDINAGNLSGLTFANKGGGIGGTDTVPAMLTPGEYVVNKSAAQSIGYSNLSKMNQTGVSRFQDGGMVGLAGAGKGGARAFRGMGQAGIGQFARENQGAARQMAKFAKTTVEAQAAMITYSRAVSSGKTATEALRQASLSANAAHMNSAKASNTLAKDSKQLDTTTKSYNQKLKGLLSTARSGIGSAAGAVRKTARQLDPIAGAAQSFVFAGAMAASLATQFSSLSDVQKQAITETVGFTTTIVGLGGTMAQIFTSMAAAGSAEVIASENVTNSKMKEAAVGNGLTTGLLSIAGAALITVSVLKYLSAAAQAAADAAFKQRDAILDQIAKGGTGQGAAQATMEGRIALAQKDLADDSIALGGAASVAGAALGAVVLQSTGAAAAMGSFAGPAGIAIGAIIGLGAGFAYYYTQVESVTDATQNQTSAIRDSINAIIGLSRSAYVFDRALSEIDEVNLTPQARLLRRQEKRKELQTSSAGADSARLSLQVAIGQHGLGVTPETFEREGRGDLADSFRLDQKVLEAEQKNLDTAIKSAREDLRAAEQLPGIFEEGSVNAGIYDQAIHNVVKSLGEQQESLNKAAFNQEKGAEAFAKLPESEDGVDASKREKQEIAAITKGRADQEKITNRAIHDTYNSRKQLKVTTDALAKSELAAARAADEFRKRADSIRDFGASLASLEGKLSDWGQSLDNSQAIINGTAQNFSKTVHGLDDLSIVKDVTKFNTDLKSVVVSLPKEMQAAGLQAVESLTATATLLTKGRKDVLEALGAGSQVGATPNVKENFEKFLDKAGIKGGFFENLDKTIRDDLLKNFGNLIGQGLTGAEFDELVKDIVEEAKRHQENFKRTNEYLNKDIQSRQKFLQIQQSLRDKSIAADQKLINSRLKTAELMAKARGKELSTQAKEGARIAAAQRALRGTDLVAGDSSGARALITRNNAERKRIRDTEERLTNAQVARDHELATETKQATAELARLADQGAHAADILGDLDKERAKQDAAISILEGFVTGGRDSRRAMLKDAASVNMAIRTGTIQNQPEEQRGRTFAMLDQLKDIDLVQDQRFGAMSGADVKKFITLSDSVRFGLISQEQAFKAMTQSTKEEKLINSLDMLRKSVDKAAGDEAAIAKGAAIDGVPFTASKKLGGMLRGRSHASGGIPVEAEGGEYVVSKKATAKYGERKLNSVNNGTAAIHMQYGGKIDEDDLPGILPSDDPTNFGYSTPKSQQTLMTDEEFWKGGFGPGFGSQPPAIPTDDLPGILQPGAGGFGPGFGSQPPAPHELDQSLEGRRARIAAKEQARREAAAKRRKEKGYTGLTRNTTGAGSNLSKDFNREEHEKSRQGARDRIAAKEEARRTKADERKANRAAESPKDKANRQRSDRRTRQGKRQAQIEAGTAKGPGIEAKKRVEARGGISDPYWEHYDKVDQGKAGGTPASRAAERVKEGRGDITGATPAARAKQRVEHRGKVGGAAGGGGQVSQAMYNQQIMRQAGAGYGGGGGGMNPALQAASYQPQQQPPMRRNGFVGGANMQAASAAGGGMSIDPTALQGVLSNFVQEFSGKLTELTGPITTMGDSLKGIAESLKNITMTHSFSGEIGMSVNIANKDAIIAAVSEGITPKIAQMIANAVNGSNEVNTNDAKTYEGDIGNAGKYDNMA